MSEAQVRQFILYNLDWFIDKLEEMFRNKLNVAKKIRFCGEEFSLPKLKNGKRIYGGGRVDLMFSSDDIMIPVELKQKANFKSIEQLNHYVDLCLELYDKKSFGILVCYNCTAELMQMVGGEKHIILVNIENNYYV